VHFGWQPYIVLRGMNLLPDRDCLDFLESVRWNGRPICPYCHSERVTATPKERRHRCNNCNTAFSVTVGTIFHRTHLPLPKWFAAISLIFDATTPIPARHLAQQLGIDKNTAWRISTRIHAALLEPSQRDLLLEIADLSETYADVSISRKTGATK
jgi:transposase-like protein